MNHNEEIPESLGGLGDELPADVLKMVNQVLELLHRKDKDHQGSKIEIVYVASGGQHVENQIILGAYPGPPKPHPLTPSPRGEGGVDSAEASKILPEVLSTDKAMVLWKKAQEAGYVDENFQPLISRTQAALLADAMAKRLGIKEKWKVFEGLWNRRNMYRDYHDAHDQRQSLKFQDKLKELFR
jgi:hypothetical protein